MVYAFVQPRRYAQQVENTQCRCNFVDKKSAQHCWCPLTENIWITHQQ